MNFPAWTSLRSKNSRRNKSDRRHNRGLRRNFSLESLEDRLLLTTIGLNPIKDNTLIEDTSGTSSNGAGDVFVGVNAEANRIRRGLLDFDIAGNVPAGATINSVSLTMWVNRTRVGDRNIELHRVLAEWGEAGSFGRGGAGGPAEIGDATWLHTFYNDQFWSNLGGDFSPTTSAVQAIGSANSFYTWNSTPQMVADVQGWLDAPDTAHGWLLKAEGEDSLERSAKRFASRESSNPDQWPLLTIDYTEAAPPALSITDVTIAEGDSGAATAQFEVTLSAASGDTVSVDFATADGTAVAGTDYQAASGTLTFAPGQTAKTIPISVTGDTVVESDEAFSLNLSNPSGATIADGQATGTISNDDSATISIDDVTLAEGDAGTTAFTFTATLNAAVDAAVNVDFATADGSATTADNDYAANSGTLAFSGNAGETQTITVNANGDEKVELDETFLVNLSNVAAGGRDVTIADGQGAGTISNDDSATISIDDVTLAEGDAGTTAFTFTATLNAAVNAALNVDFATADGSATTADNDYAANSGTLAFSGNAGETQTITVNVNGDEKVELDETFLVNLSNVAAGGRDVTIADGQGAGTIGNDDSASLPTISVSDVTITEGNSGTVLAQFEVTLSAASGDTVSVDFATADGTAVAGTDYQAASGTLTFAPGETAKTIPISVAGDTVVESDEAFSFNLSNPSGATIADGQATGTITNDDSLPPTITPIDDQTINEDTSTGPLGFTIGDADTDVGELIVTATSSDQAVVSDADISVGGSGSNRTIEVVPLQDANGGPVTITVSLSDGIGTVTETFAVIVIVVNDAPSLDLLPGQSVPANSGSYTIPGFATAAPGGGPDEAGQTFTYTVSSDNVSLFAVEPKIGADGTLTYEVAPDVAGTAIVTVSVTDSGGTANGGVDTSLAQTFTIEVLSGDTVTVEQQIADLIDEVDQLGNAGILNGNQVEDLSKKLEEALDELGENEESDAVEELGDFVEKVNELVDQSVLSPEQGGELVEAAEDIVDAIRAGDAIPVERQITDLMGRVRELGDSGVLNRGQVNDLSKKLDEALRKLNEDEGHKAIEKLGDFIEKVNKLTQRGVLSPMQGAELIEAAEHIIDAVGAEDDDNGERAKESKREDESYVDLFAARRRAIEAAFDAFGSASSMRTMKDLDSSIESLVNANLRPHAERKMRSRVVDLLLAGI